MRRPSRTGLSWLFVLCTSAPLIAQNLESIGKEKPFTFSGGVSFNQIFYTSHGIASRRDPYSYFASGNLNLALYGWSVPLTFSVSNSNTSFSQPFNQYSIHPTWKWITAHAGYTAMSFSPYTVNGHIFSGGGIELTPDGKWTFSALYGRFLKAVNADSTQDSRQPSFERWGYGVKARHGDGSDFIDVILFHAEDDPGSIADTPGNLQIAPEENLVMSLSGGKTLFKHFLVKGELATSAISKDTRAGKTTHENLLARSLLFQSRLSSSYYRAFKTSLDYHHEGWIIGTAYERIDPGYRTLGAYYFNSDLKNITVHGSSVLLKDKMNIAVSAGIQHDNVDKTKISTMRRMVSAFSMNYSPSQKFNLSASWSTFQTYTNIRSQFETINQLTPYDNLDTLNFAQISRNASLSGMVTLPANENKRQNVNVNLTWQEATDRQGNVPEQSAAYFYNINAGYSLSLIPKNLRVAVTFNTTIHEGPMINTRVLGPTASVSKSLFRRKVRTTLSSSWNKTYSHGVATHTQINGRLNGVCAIHKRHNINVSAVAVKRTMPERMSGSTTEFTANVGYVFSFSSQ